MRRRPLTWLGVVALAAIVVAGTLATSAAVRHEGDAAEARRSEVAEPAIRALADEVVATVSSLEDLRAFFEASESVTAVDFHRFAAAPLDRRAALEFLAWSPLSLDGPPRVALVERRGAITIVPADVLATPATRRAMDAARDTAIPRMTPPLTGADGTRVTIIVSPVYAPGADVATVDQRRAALRGFVSGGSVLALLGRVAGADLPPGVRIDVRDAGMPVLGDGGGSVEGSIDVAGRRWSVALSGVPGASVTLPAAIAATGLLLTAIVGLMFASSTGRERSARSELARLRTRHDLILASADDGIIGLDPDVRAGFVNPAAARMLGWEVDDLIGGRIDELVMPELAGPVRTGRQESGEGVMRRRDGGGFPGEYTINPIDEDGEPRGAVVVFRDVTARKRAEARTLEDLADARERAAIDPLTELANHRTFHERLRTEIQRARRHGRGLSLVLMDLDHFKRVNDQHGHQVGDRVLEHAAQVMSAETRTGDMLARVGGEEFAMILPEADEAEAFRAAERVRTAVAAARFPAVGTMTLSAGVCDLSQAQDADTLYRLADSALYRAKNSGRDIVVRFSGRDGDRAEDASGGGRGGDAPRPGPRNALAGVHLLARVVDEKDPSSRGHSERVAQLCGEIAGVLGWSPERTALLREAALVHDIGKIGIADALLRKAGPLTPAERTEIEKHPEAGADILRGALTAEQTAWVRAHHERWDGAGYPDGLKAEDCPEGARILALAEAWDVMTSERSYAPMPLNHAQAASECRAHAGTQFWAPAVDALVRLRGDA